MVLKHFRDIGIRIFLSLVLLSSAYLSATRAIARWYFRQPPPEGLYQAISWDPRNPIYHSTLGRVLLQSAAEIDPEEIVRLFERATQLSPQTPQYWTELAGALEWAGRQERARQAIESARNLFPNSPEINWHLGNHYLRVDKTAEALTAFHKVLLGRPGLRHQVFDLAWRASENKELILDRMVPAVPEIMFQYLNYLSAKGLMDDAQQVWTRIIQLNFPFEPHSAFPFLDALVRQKRVDELTAAWSTLAESKRPTLVRPNRGTNLITNGDFESPILNGGLGWRVRPVEGLVASVDNITFFDGTQSLKVRFDGEHNLSYSHISQYVPVKSNSGYRFIVYLRSKGITTDSGPRLRVTDAYDTRRLDVSTDDAIGTSNWTPQQLDFRTGPRTRLLRISLIRTPSRKLDNKIAGSLWIDRISLNPTE